ncbi:ribonuclease E/G [Nocardioides sp. URHA0032]|uniref:ribonuclease E/G n=1 Tax=Nocardioides sp. URHA0032 TaxID=1380388 RepID=UPI00048A54CE|nr:ribonuclease E/G [Nocardioides sp. URHA0032]
MADDLQVGSDQTTDDAAPAEKPVKKTAAKKAAKKAPAKKAGARKTAAKAAAPADEPLDVTVDAAVDTAEAPAKKAPAKKAAKKAATKKTTAKTTAKKSAAKAVAPAEDDPAEGEAPVAGAPAVLFQAPETTPETTPAKKSAAKKTAAKKTTAKKATAKKADPESEAPAEAEAPAEEESADAAEGDGTGARRRRRRGGRRRRKPGGEGGDAQTAEGDESGDDEDEQDEESTPAEDGHGESTSSRRRRRRRRSGDDSDGNDDPDNTVTRVRSRRSAEDEITAVSGSTRLEAKKQRRREGREAGRRRAPIVSEAEFLARRESVDRVMVIRQRDELTQIGVLEDRVLVEHYVARESQTSLIGNVYLGRVQNVLPSMEAAFIDIGKGRNAVLYAGEVNWSSLGHKDGQPRKIESVLSSGQTVLVQVTKDPIGHKGARLTSQVSLAGRFLVYVPDGTTSGISRKLPDTERNRLKALLKEIVPDSAGVIVRTAAEGASEDELTRDVERLKARWEDIERKAKGSAPQLLYGEPDLTLKVVRDLFTEDFSRLVIQGDDAWETVQSYVQHVAPDLEKRLERYEPGEHGRGGKADVFAEYRIDEQIAKGLDRKVWLPSGGSLVIDRTEAMTVVDVNTGKFTGSGGNLEETVTKNNLEAAEEIVRQLRLRDIGGIIVVDFIDMVLESNRDLVLRRMVECLGRDRTRHQVAEVTSLGLVQMTRKRIGTGLLEAFSETCEHCQGRGVIVHEHPVEPRRGDDESRRPSSGGRRGRRGRGEGEQQSQQKDAPKAAPSPKDVAAMAKPENGDHAPFDEPFDEPFEQPVAEPVDEPAQQPAAEPEKPQVSTRSRRRSASRPAGEPEADAEPAEEPAEEPVEQPVEQPPAEPEKPQVSTRSRRRSASRPAGEPEAVVATPEPVVAPVVEPVIEDAPEEVPAAPEPPKVVTRTRRRAASRPAGPPVREELPAPVGTLGSVGAPPVDGAVEPGTAAAEPGSEPDVDGDHPHIEHVPIKKKGSRKR